MSSEPIRAALTAWRLLAQFASTRRVTSWLELPDGTSLLVVCTTEGTGLSQEVCWELIAFFDQDEGRAFFPERVCCDSQRAVMNGLDYLLTEARAASHGDSLEAILGVLRTIPECPL